jgi:hypothetical protein
MLLLFMLSGIKCMFPLWDVCAHVLLCESIMTRGGGATDIGTSHAYAQVLPMGGVKRDAVTT